MIDRYMRQINHTNPLSKKEEKTATKNSLINANLKFVVKIAHQYKGMLPLEDLVQEGNKGLIIAAEKFDPKKYNVKFITYAFYWIKKYMMMAINKTTPVSGGHGKCQVFSLDDHINEDSKKTKNEIFNLEDSYSLPQNKLIESEKICYIRDVIKNNLLNKEANVIYSRFGLDDGRPKTLREISKKMGYTIPGISAIEKRAKEKLKNIIDISQI